MKTTMNLATSKGFIFRNGKLMAYEFISALVDYQSETVEYTCKLGGRKTTFMADECPEVYAGAKEFKAQVALKSTVVKWSDMLRMTFGVYASRSGCNETGEFTMWTVEDNQPVAVPAPKANFLYRKHWDIDYVGKGDFLNSREIALLHCDLIKVDENGEETREASPASKMKLTDEQAAAVKAIEKAIEDAKKLGVQLIFDRDNSNFKAFSKTEVESFMFDYSDEDVDYGDLMHQTQIDVCDACCSDCKLLITWKE